MNATAKQQLSRNPSNAGYATPLKTYSVPATENPDGTINVPVQPVYPIDPNVEPIVTRMPCVIQNPTTPGTLVTTGAMGGTTGFGSIGLITQGVLNYGNTGGCEWARTPLIFRTLGLTTAAGDTALWDPAAGTRFRLMGYIIDIAAGTTAAAASTLQLRDQAVVIVNHAICGGALAASAGRVIANVVLPGNGYLSVAADNILNLNLSSVLAAGGVTAFAYGTEE